VNADASWFGGNATLNFWRGAENLAVVPANNIDNNVMIWATSQGTHLRRMHVKGALHLSLGGNSSGGFIADSLVDGTVVSGSQQQYFMRNDDNTWQGAAWNMVFLGPGTAPGGNWPNPPYTTIAATPIVREKPFLYIDTSGQYYVMVPGLRTNAVGHSWKTTAPPGSPVSIDNFYIAMPGTDTAATINAQLAGGKHLILTPGDYKLDSPINVTLPGTIVMGLGLATLTPTSGMPALTVADVDGVTLAGLVVEAGTTSSPTLLQVGPMGSNQDHSMAPTALFDVHCRVGGGSAGTAASCVTVNSNNVLLDDSWLWRADHGAGAGWNSNMCKNGLIVNGNNVSAYGLFVEHHQEYQTLWNGNGGTTYMYQSEMPYDPPNQAAWTSGTGHNGYPSYKVADSVTTHTAAGLGVYAVFNNNILADNAFETPTAAGVTVHHAMTADLAQGGITHIINGTGGSALNHSMAWSAN
jgi:hypothetical protein